MPDNSDSLSLRVNSTANSRWMTAFARAWPLLLLVAAGACLILAALRIAYSVSFRQPSQVLTSGLEEEALFSIWKFTHGQPVYSDPFSIPFSGSYFNWLFYATYGSLTWIISHTLKLSEDWIPTITHLISLGFALLCVPLTALLVGATNLSGVKRSRLLGAAAGVVVAFNPLVGWWNLTARPDMGALLLELTALYLAVQFVKTGRWRFLWAVIATAFLAWSFRQTAVNVISGFCLYLLFSRQWAAAAVAVAASFALYAVTFAGGGALYWANTVTCNGAAGFYLSVGRGNALYSIAKAPLLLAGAAAIALYLWQRRWRARQPVLDLLTATCAFSLLWDFCTSMKGGASHNYFMAAAAVSLLLGICVFTSPASGGGNQKTQTIGWSLLLLCQTLACIAVLAGAKGRIDIRDDQILTLALKQRLAEATGPVIAADRLLNLPWINPAKPNFVYAFVYRAGPLKRRQYEGGGLEGLMKQGYFKMIILTKGSRPNGWPDLAGPYDLHDEDNWFRYYTLRDR